MRPIAEDGEGRGLSVGWSVGQSVTIVSPAKTAEPIQISFGMSTPVGQTNQAMDRVLIPIRRANFEGEKGLTRTYRDMTDGRYTRSD